MLPEAIRLAALGYHFEKITRQQMALHDFRECLAAELESFKEASTHRVAERGNNREPAAKVVHEGPGTLPIDPRGFSLPWRRHRARSWRPSDPP